MYVLDVWTEPGGEAHILTGGMFEAVHGYPERQSQVASPATSTSLSLHRIL